MCTRIDKLQIWTCVYTDLRIFLPHTYSTNMFVYIYQHTCVHLSTHLRVKIFACVHLSTLVHKWVIYQHVYTSVINTSLVYIYQHICVMCRRYSQIFAQAHLQYIVYVVWAIYMTYGVATTCRLLQMTGLFCRIQSLL